MSVFNSLVFQAAAFSAIALLVFGSLTWFFFFSPLESRKQTTPVRTSPMVVNVLVGVLGFSVALMIIGALWDTSMHIKTGVVPGGSDFLWPPHLMIYGAFLIAFVVALISIGIVAVQGWRAGAHDPRRWVRANPSLGMVAAAASYALLSIPGDAIWHQLFGIDLTAWSPPHLLIALMSAIVALSAVALWLQKPGVDRRPALRDGVTLVLLALALELLYIPGVLEWELAGRAARVDARPVFLYPLVGGGIALVFLLLARNLTRFRWAATTTALIFYAVRWAISIGLALTDNIAPLFPVFFLLGAVLLDLLPWERIRSFGLRVFAQAAAFTAGYLPLELALLSQRADLPRLSPVDWLAAILITLVLGLVFAPLATWAGRRLNPNQGI